MKRIITLLLSLIVVLSSMSMLGCNKGSSGGGGSSSTGKADTDVTFEYTDIDLVKDGATQYNIVIPQNAGKFVKFAAEELQKIFAMATNITLQIVTENSAMTTEGYHLSLGDTVLRREAGTPLPIVGAPSNFFVLQGQTSAPGKEGAFIIERKNNTLIMLGVDDYGTTFAAYEFMEKQFGYKFYAADEIYIDSVMNEKLIDMNWQYTPFVQRAHLTDRMGTEESSLRYGTIRRENSLYSPHSWLTVLPYKVYGASVESGGLGHSNWYGAGGKALCISNAEMAKEFAKRAVELFDETGYASLLCGQEDDWAKCSCENCTASDAINTAAGTNVIFVNRVANEIDRILAEQGRPDFRYRLQMLSYYQYEAPPVKLVGGKYEPLNENVVFHPNVGVVYCSFAAGDASAPLSGTDNETTRSQIEGWLACRPECIEHYCYRGYFPVYNLAFPHYWSNIKDWIVTNASYGMEQIWWSVPVQSQFEAMLVYLTTQIQYDPTQNVNDLIDEFIEVFYKDAAPYVKQFFEEITGYMYYKKSINPGFNLPCLTSTASHLFSAQTWKEEMLTNWVKLFEQAQEAVANSDVDKTTKELLEIRVDDESLWPRYWLVNLYGKVSLTASEYTKQRAEVLADALRAGYTEDGVGSAARFPE